MPQIINVNRPGPGVVTSGVQDVTGLAQPDTLYTLTGNFSNAADLNDGTLTCSYELRLDGQTVWGPNEWRGGIAGRDGVVRGPIIQYSTEAILPTTAEAVYTFNKQPAGRFTVDLDFPKVR